jgi:glutamate racemase
VKQVVAMRDRPIGVFDSGIGGLTVVRQLLASLPEESILYFGDTARVPYGIKSAETVTRFTREAAHFLIRRDIKALIVACNSASACALPALQREWELPIMGVILPGARAAAAATHRKRVGVLGTPATIGSGAYETALAAIDASIEVRGRACPLFVPLAEEGWTEGPVPEEAARVYLQPLLEWGADTLVLGCTHYPLLKETLQKVAGPEVTLIDTAIETVSEVRDLLAQRELLAEAGSAVHEFYVSDVPAQFRTVGERFLGQPIETLRWIDQDDLPWYER